MALVLASLATPASAACWGARSEAGAKVRAFQSMLMVGTLRCHAFGRDITPAYNAFVDSRMSELQQANATIKAHIAAADPGDPERGYDSFTTALANRYGDAATSRSVCDALAGLAAQAASAEGFDALVTLADAAAVDPALPGGRCAAALSEVLGELEMGGGTH